MSVGATSSLPLGTSISARVATEAAAPSSQLTDAVTQPLPSGRTRSAHERPPDQSRESNEFPSDEESRQDFEKRAEARERYTPNRARTRAPNDSLGRLLDLRA
jgi:hypothetical protein